MTRPAAVRPALLLFSNTHLLVLSSLIILLAGYSALANLPRLEDPRITPRYPKITTFLPGASAARVEALITEPIEDSLREIAEIKELSSTSLAGVSTMIAELDDSVSKDRVDAVFSEIQNQLNIVSAELPAEASQPEFDSNNNAVAFSQIVAINWTLPSTAELGVMRRLAEDLADGFRAIHGTELVRVYGAPEEEVDVVLDAVELAALGATVTEVAQRINSADVKLSAGLLRDENYTLALEVDAEIESLERIKRVPLRLNEAGDIRTVGDLAEVSKAWRTPPRDITLTDGTRSILVAALAKPDTRLDEWTAAADQRVQAFRDQFGGGLSIDTVFTQNAYTQARLASLASNLMAGAILVVLVVLVSMGWRSALIVGSALPLSASITLFGLSVVGQQIHQMAIFGMIIAIGLLIDNAIVMTDQVKRHLDSGSVPEEALSKSIKHLFVPLLTSTLTTVLGFMPVFLLPGAMGDFVGPIAIAVVFALCASFAVALTLIPAYSARFLHSGGESRQWWVSGMRFRRLNQRYRGALAFFLRRPALGIALCMLLPSVGFGVASTLGEQFFPPADRNQFEVELRMPSTSSITLTQRTAEQIEQAIKTQPGVKEVHWRIGGTYPTLYYNRIMRQQRNDAYAHGIVFTESVAATKRLTASLPGLLQPQFTQAQIVVAPFAQGPPVDSPVGFQIRGSNPQTLRQLGEQLRGIMHTVPGIVATRATIAGGQAKLDFELDEFVAREAGFTLDDIAMQMNASLEGNLGGALLEDLEELPVRVRLDNQQRQSLAAIEGLMLQTGQTDRWVPASVLGEFKLRPESSSISRRDGVRTNEVMGYISHDVLPIDVSKAIVKAIDSSDFELPPGYDLRLAGDSAEQGEALKSLFTYLPILAMIMLASLVLSFRSVVLALHIILVAILSVGLGMFCLWLGGYARGFNAIIGSIGLIGVAINGTIVVIAAIRSNAAALAGDQAAIVAETVNATRHIVSTTLTTVGGFLPLLLFSGGDFWPPLAIVIAGGVAFSITLSLLITPVVYRVLVARRYLAVA